MYDQVVKCQRAGLCLSEHFLIVNVYVNIDSVCTKLYCCLVSAVNMVLCVKGVSSACYLLYDNNSNK